MPLYETAERRTVAQAVAALQDAHRRGSLPVSVPTALRNLAAEIRGRTSGEGDPTTRMALLAEADEYERRADALGK